MLTLAVCGSVGTYGLINAWVARTPIDRTLPTAVDALVPFEPRAIFLYGSIYGAALAPACLVQDRRLLLRGLAAYGALLLAGVPFWLLWPVTVPREPVPVTDLATWGVALMRWLDPPANCFPSMHVGEPVLAAVLCGAMHRRLGLVLALLALGVWWSTLALDQHWFVDGLAGALIALTAGTLALRWRPLPPEALHPRPLRHLGWAAACYLTLFLTAAVPWWLGLVGPEMLTP